MIVSFTEMYFTATLGKMLLSFSAYTNGKTVLQVNQPAGTLTALNGIRVLSIFWVVLSHTYFLNINIASTEFQTLRLISTYLDYQLITQFNQVSTIYCFIVSSSSLMKEFQFLWYCKLKVTQILKTKPSNTGFSKSSPAAHTL